MQKNADRVDLEKCWKMSLLSLSEASIQPRTGPPKLTNLLDTGPSSRRRNSHGYICTPVVASASESAQYAAPHAMTQNDAPKTRSRILFVTKSSRTNTKAWASVFIRYVYCLLLTLSAFYHSSGRKSAFEIHEQPDRVELRMKYYTTRKKSLKN